MTPNAKDLDRARALISEHDDVLSDYPGMRQEIIAAIRQALAEERARAAALVPTSWLDSGLSGREALPGAGPWGCRDIERLLVGLAKEIRAGDAA